MLSVTKHILSRQESEYRQGDSTNTSDAVKPKPPLQAQVN
jgi:hypothetical protein